MPGWNDLEHLVSEEFVQSKSEGRDAEAVESLRPELLAAGQDPSKLRDVWRRVLAIPIRADFPFVEPSDLEGIRSARPPAKGRRFEIPQDQDWLFDRMYGAWLGRCAGCALGKPVESYMESRNGLDSKGRIKHYLTAIGPHEWPLNHYFPKHSPALPVLGSLSWGSSTRESIGFMEMDDDICYTVIGQMVLQRHGLSFTTRDVAFQWLNSLPFRYLCGGDAMAYRNLVMEGEFLQGKRLDIDWNWVANNDNPYREWIGAQIRADPWGYAAPGNPELAAELGWRDARMSHVKNGIYGEMFVAAMIAAAFAIHDVRAIVDAGLAEIPRDSRLSHDIRKTIEVCDKFGNDSARFEEVFEELYQLFGHYRAVHTNNNAAIVVAAMLLGRDDFEKVITLSVMAGWDTDCNGATAGSICGAMVGASRIPPKWTSPLNDTLKSGLLGYDPIRISECAKRSVEIAIRGREC